MQDQGRCARLRCWHCLEHDWLAEEGSNVEEPPGATHMFDAPGGVETMITWFSVSGVMWQVDPCGAVHGQEDVCTKIRPLP